MAKISPLAFHPPRLQIHAGGISFSLPDVADPLLHGGECLLLTLYHEPLALKKLLQLGERRPGVRSGSPRLFRRTTEIFR